MAPTEQWADFYCFEKPSTKESQATPTASDHGQQAGGRSSSVAIEQPSSDLPDRKAWPRPWHSAANAPKSISGRAGRQKFKVRQTPASNVKEDETADPATDRVEDRSHIPLIPPSATSEPRSTAGDDSSRVVAAHVAHKEYRPWTRWKLFIGFCFVGWLVAWLVPLGMGSAQIPVVSHPLFGIERWDKLLNTTASVQSSLQNLTSTDSDQIQESIHEARVRHPRCRNLITGVSKTMGIDIVELVQEWVLRGNCTPALPLAVKGVAGSVGNTMKCMKSVLSNLSTATNATHAAAAQERENYNAIVELYKPSWRPTMFRSGQTQVQLEIDGQRQRQAQKNCNTLSLVQVQMVEITRDWQAEYDRQARLEDDLLDLVPLIEPADSEAIDGSGNCLGFDTVKIGDRFLSLASRATDSDEKAHQLSTRFYEKDSVQKVATHKMAEGS
ncbi:MAG: hypothetical protein Q9192_001587 [Flavoplaca navasiana]